MSTTYKIIVKNGQGQARDYAIFSSAPVINADGTTTDAYINAWITQRVAANGYLTITTSTDFYAWAGTAPSYPAPGVILQTGTSQLAQLGQGGPNGSTFPMTVTGGTPEFGTPTMTADAGAFEIDTDSSFASPNDTYLVGLGKVDNHGIVSPVASILASNNSSITITPIMKFYVGTFSFQGGEIVDFQTVAKKCGVVDFSSSPGLGKFTAVVNQDKFGKFTTTYYTSPQTVEIMQSIRDCRFENFISGALSNEDKKLRELHKLIGKFSSLLNGMDLGPPSAGKLERQEWIGLVNWPVTTTVAVVSTAIGLISGFLIARKYKVTYKTTKKPDGTTSASFYFGPANGLALEYRDVFQDWNAAVNADTQQDGHINGGLIAGSQASTNSSLDQMCLSLMQLGDVLDKGFGDSFTNGQGNRYANDFGDGFAK